MGKLTKLPNRLATVPQRLAPKPVLNSWGKGKGATARGYTYKWEQYRKGFLMRHPLCVRCTQLGVVTAATVVDHIIPHQGDIEGPQSLFWKQDNHQSLCKPCHDGWKAQEEALLGFR